MPAKAHSRPKQPDRRRRRESLSLEAWLGFLDEEVLEQRPCDRLRAGGQALRETDARALRRWRVERTRPSVWRADEFLTRYLGGGGLDQYFAYCERNELWPWATPEPPSWAAS